MNSRLLGTARRPPDQPPVPPASATILPSVLNSSAVGFLVKQRTKILQNRGNLRPCSTRRRSACPAESCLRASPLSRCRACGRGSVLASQSHTVVRGPAKWSENSRWSIHRQSAPPEHPTADRGIYPWSRWPTKCNPVGFPPGCDARWRRRNCGCHGDSNHSPAWSAGRLANCKYPAPVVSDQTHSRSAVFPTQQTARDCWPDC